MSGQPQAMNPPAGDPLNQAGQGMIGGRIAPESKAVTERWRWTCDCGDTDYAHRADDCAADLLDHLAESHYFIKGDA